MNVRCTRCNGVIDTRKDVDEIRIGKVKKQICLNPRKGGEFDDICTPYEEKVYKHKNCYGNKRKRKV